MALNNILDTTHKGYLIRVFYIPRYGFDGHARKTGEDTTTFFTLGKPTAQEVIDILKGRINEEISDSEASRQAFANGRDAEKRTGEYGELEY